jgi:hypothetical protein
MAPTTVENPSEGITSPGLAGLSRRSFVCGLAATGATLPIAAALAQETGSANRLQAFQPSEVLDSGHKFFGSVTRGLAGVVEEATKRWGQPNGYVLGQEAGGAIIGGLRYGEGTLFTRNAGDYRAFWQGPSLGLDVGGDGARTMMLVYQLANVPALYQRFGGIDGSAFIIGGFGMTALAAGDMMVVPIRTGVGARLGINIGYLKFTTAPTWNPF